MSPLARKNANPATPRRFAIMIEDATLFSLLEMIHNPHSQSHAVGLVAPGISLGTRRR